MKEFPDLKSMIGARLVKTIIGIMELVYYTDEKKKK